MFELKTNYDFRYAINRVFEMNKAYGYCLYMIQDSSGIHEIAFLPEKYTHPSIVESYYAVIDAVSEKIDETLDS